MSRDGRRCEHCRKWLYGSERLAETAARRMRRRGERAVAYRCKHYRYGWHVGHTDGPAPRPPKRHGPSKPRKP